MPDQIVNTGGEKEKPLVPDYSRKKPANHKAQEFVERYLISKNPIEACKGLYKNPRAAAIRLMANKVITTYIDKRIQENLTQIRLSKDDYLQRLYNEYANAKQEASRLKALDMIGSVLGHLKPKQEESALSIYDLMKSAQALLPPKRVEPVTQMPESAASKEVADTETKLT